MMCPYLSGINLDGELVKVACQEYACAKYVQVMGANPQTGEQVNEWKCADAWIPILLIEGSQQTRQAGAAVVSFRNEVVQVGQNMVKELSARGNGQWLESKSET